MDREQMIQALGLVADGCLYFDERDEDGEVLEGQQGRYMDWSIVRYSGMRVLELGDGHSTAQFEVTRAELVALHAALTATLLTDER